MGQEHHLGVRRRFWLRGATLGAVVFLVTAVLAVGCSGSDGKGGKDEAGLPRGLVRQGPTVVRAVGSDGALSVRVAHAAVEFPVGSLAAGSTVRLTPSSSKTAPDHIGDVELSRVAAGVFVDLGEAHLSKPATVTFDHVDAGAGASPLALHRDDAGRYALLPAELHGTKLVVSTRNFSLVSWGTGHLLKPVADFMAAKLAGRTSPARCDAPPAWASVDGSPSGSTHACVRTGQPRSDGAEIVELEIKSNRGNYQWVDLPSDLPREYVWVEDQNDLARALLRRTLHSDSVLLGPGQRMTVGYRQPVDPAQLRFRTRVDTLTGLMTIGRLFLDGITNDAINKTGGYLAVLHCFGVVDVNLADTENPAILQSPELLTSLVPCIFDTVKDFAEHPDKAVAAARDILGANANEQNLTELSQQLFKLGKFAALIGEVLSLGSYILKELAFITDAAVEDFGRVNATTITLTLNARRSVPVLGADGWAPYVDGFGIARPNGIGYGGDPTGLLDDITWSSWGDAKAEGDGTAVNLDDSPDETVASAPQEPAHVVAWDLGDCKGHLAYRKVGWYFHDEPWSPDDFSYDICNGN